MKKEVKYLILVLLAVGIASFAAYKFLVVPGADPRSQVKTGNPQFSLVSNMASNHSFSYGPVDAKVTVVEFFDPECESCSAIAPQIKKEMKFYEGKVRWVFRYMPYHNNSKNAIAALEAARKQDLFLEAMTALFETQHQWGEKQESTKDMIVKIVTAVPGIDKVKFMQDLEDPATNDIIVKDQTEGKQAGVKGTPSFYVNGVMLERLSLDDLIASINRGLGE